MQAPKEADSSKVVVQLRLEQTLYAALIAQQRQGERPADTIERVLGDVFGE